MYGWKFQLKIEEFCKEHPEVKDFYGIKPWYIKKADQLGLFSDVRVFVARSRKENNAVNVVNVILWLDCNYFVDVYIQDGGLRAELPSVERMSEYGEVIGRGAPEWAAI